MHLRCTQTEIKRKTVVVTKSPNLVLLLALQAFTAFTALNKNTFLYDAYRLRQWPSRGAEGVCWGGGGIWAAVHAVSTCCDTSPCPSACWDTHTRD